MIRICCCSALTLLALPPCRSRRPPIVPAIRLRSAPSACWRSIRRRPRRSAASNFRETLPLAPKEVVLTFDDGPWPGTTDRVLAALKHECVRATFFMLGRNAAAHPALAKRVLAEGHTVAHHTYKHPLLNRMPLERAEAEIDHGIAAVEAAVYGEPGGPPRTPFFRFPGFASSPALLDRLKARGIAVFGADLWPGDWNPMTPQHERALLLQRLTEAGGGIVLLHDTQAEDCGDAAGVAARTKAPRLSRGAYRAGRRALSNAR